MYPISSRSADCSVLTDNENIAGSCKRPWSDGWRRSPSFDSGTQPPSIRQNTETEFKEPSSLVTQCLREVDYKPFLDSYIKTLSERKISTLQERIAFCYNKNKIADLATNLTLPENINDAVASYISEKTGYKAQQLADALMNVYHNNTFGVKTPYVGLWRPDNYESFDAQQSNNTRPDKAVPLRSVIANRQSPLSNTSMAETLGNHWYRDPEKVFLYMFGTIDHFPESFGSGQSITKFFVVGDSTCPLVIGIDSEYTEMTPDHRYHSFEIYSLKDYLEKELTWYGTEERIIQEWLLNNRCPEEELPNCSSSKYWLPVKSDSELPEVPGAVAIPARKCERLF